MFLKFVSRIERGYHSDVSYHNSIHAADVLHGMTWLKDRCSHIIKPTDLEMMSMYFAAIIHDFDHPGLNNNFLVSTQDRKALLYNDRSVLENHHLAAGFAVLMNPDYNCNFLSNLPREEFKSFREMVIELVLATDLQTQHFAMLSMFKNKISITETFNPENIREDRLLLWKMMIKCADVSNPTKKWKIYEKWTSRILEEFFNQGDQEKRVGLPVSPYFDRDTIFVPGSQLGFIEFICVPLFEAFNSFMEIPCILEGLRTNRSHWLHQKEEHQKEHLKAQTAQQQAQNDSQTIPVPKSAASLIKDSTPQSSMTSLPLGQPNQARFQKKLTINQGNTSSPKSSALNATGASSGSLPHVGILAKATTRSNRPAAQTNSIAKSGSGSLIELLGDGKSKSGSANQLVQNAEKSTDKLSIRELISSGIKKLGSSDNLNKM